MKLSVAMITYNHERFIAQAIDSVLMQQVNFDYEIVIGEDCSTDATRDIVAGYQRKYPDKIRLLPPKTNMGGNKNLSQTLHACLGEYVALLEGDDYWISPYKLQKQVDFLDRNPDFALCFHNVMVVDELQGRTPRNHCCADQPEVSTFEDILSKNFIATLSTVFRRNSFAAFPQWVYQLKMGDWPLHTLVAQHGKIKYLNEVMGVYRVHQGGMWSMSNDILRIEADIMYLQLINAHLGYKYDKIINGARARSYFNLSVIYEDLADTARARACMLDSIRALPLSHYKSNAEFFIRSFRLYAPTAYRLLKLPYSTYLRFKSLMTGSLV